MREWGAEAVTSLVRSALTHDHDPPLKQDLVSHVVDIIGQPRYKVLDHSTRLLLNGERMDGHWERKEKDEGSESYKIHGSPPIFINLQLIAN